jgi:RimJ/RimL family protein N-acetyltransferase
MQVFLETGRLVLRRFSLADVDNLVNLDADPDVMRYITGGIPTSREEIQNEFLPAFGGVEYALDRAGWQQQDTSADGCPPS